MDTPTPHLIGPLYHGTRAASARCILRDGFRRSRSRNYTGTGICLSESLTLAYEYGMYETGGCVLQAWLALNRPGFSRRFSSSKNTGVRTLPGRAGW